MKFQRVALVSISIIVCHTTLRAADDKEGLPSLDEVRRGLAVRDAAFQSVKFRVTYHERISKIFGSPPFDKVRVIDAILDTSRGASDGPNRTRAEVVQTPDPESAYIVRGAKWIRTIRTCTPGGAEAGRILSYTLDSEGRPATVGHIQTEGGLGMGTYPNELPGLNFASPSYVLFSAMSEAHVAVEGVERIDGHRAVRVSWDFERRDIPPGSLMKGTYWLAPDLGWAMLRYEIRRKPSVAASWKPVNDMRAEDFLKRDGLWVPTRGTHVVHKYLDDGSYAMERELVADFEEWSLNFPLTDEMFKLEFPDGTIVRDHVRGDITYRKGAVNDPDIARHVKAAQTIAPPSDVPTPALTDRLDQALTNDPFARRGLVAWIGWLVGSLVLIACLAIGTLIVSKRPRRRMVP